MTWTLLGLGWQPWTRVVELCDGLTCSWGDYTGFHTGDCPPTAPPYSHVWGWSSDRFVRVRVDGDQGIVGLLTRTDADTWRPADVDEPVSIDISRAFSASKNRPPTWLLQVTGPSPVTFVSGAEVTDTKSAASAS
jgi:hypothetical protein